MGSAQSERIHPYKIIAVGVLAVAAAALVVYAAKILIALFAGILFALGLRGAADALSRHTRLPYGVCLGAVVLALVASVVVAVPLLGPSISEQVEELAKALPDAARALAERLRRGPLAPAIPPETAESLQTPQKSFLSAMMSAMGASIAILGSIAIAFFVGVYGAAQPEAYTRAVLALTPAAQRPRVRWVLSSIASTLTRWLLGRFVAMVFVGVTTAIAFTLLHVPLAITLAVVAGLLTFIEYIGAVVSAIPPVLLAFTVSPATALWVLVLFAALHVISGYVIDPLLARVTVRFPPALTLAGQVVMGTLLGPIGLTFSTPLLVVAVVAVSAWRSDQEARTPPVDERENPQVILRAGSRPS